MTKLILTILLFVNYSCSSAKLNMDTLRVTILEIDFQDFFERDKIELRLDDCIVFTDSLITSDKSDGFTGLSVKVYSQDKSKVLVCYLNKEFECKMRLPKININISLNGNLNRYIIDVNKGKYIGFSKKVANELYLTQSVTSFSYD